MAQCFPRNVQMPLMRRVEGAAKQADANPVVVTETRDAQGRTWPVPRTM
jgi:hypothetical protein